MNYLHTACWEQVSSRQEMKENIRLSLALCAAPSRSVHGELVLSEPNTRLYLCTEGRESHVCECKGLLRIAPSFPPTLGNVHWSETRTTTQWKCWNRDTARKCWQLCLYVCVNEKRENKGVNVMTSLETAHGGKNHRPNWWKFMCGCKKKLKMAHFF